MENKEKIVQAFWWTNALSVYNEVYQSLEDDYQEYLRKNE